MAEPKQYGRQPRPGYSLERNWVMTAHVGGAAGALLGGVAGWVAPLLALLNQGGRSPTVRAAAVQALNFQILWTIVALVGWATRWLAVGTVIVPVAAAVAVIFGLIAGTRALGGEPYDYPATARFIRE
ncbi:hypothetical protein ACWT_1283 [Actinoplanes sp. SE50]|uniref:DUF4870 domain-containing protein n=1 Tax=unclassified Actinoplanes TaxID=2626549 RepID=UPI00023EBB0F|nr:MULTISPECIES: DUF4870 domain-containing protein [unclassified Actinoplanes]AEV82301.1 hypothetical protein ACPL_1404 [Actinoplanes sp. SE50/110]ATO80698.1 hypothetical protein ACWT_1283 [Actinoplanes sp. SE50]SLL98105.1 hypothetical protein ACSP50_1327 [Actinoplanes sp. SE50/110]